MNIIPQNLKGELLDHLAHGIGEWADEHGHESIAKSARHLASDHAFLEALDGAWKSGVDRFSTEYDDREMVAAINKNEDFWKSPSVKAALLKLASHPGAWLEGEQATVNQHFDDVLPGYPRERVSRAVGTLLRYIVEALWQLPGAAQVRELYAFQFQKLTAEAVTAQVQLGQAHLAVAQQLGSEIREMVAQLNQLVAQALPAAAALALPSGAAAALPAPAAETDITILYERINARFSADDLRLLCVQLREADIRLRDLDENPPPHTPSFRRGLGVPAATEALLYANKRATM